MHVIEWHVAFGSVKFRINRFQLFFLQCCRYALSSYKTSKVFFPQQSINLSFVTEMKIFVFIFAAFGLQVVKSEHTGSRPDTALSVWNASTPGVLDSRRPYTAPPHDMKSSPDRPMRHSHRSDTLHTAVLRRLATIFMYLYYEH